MSSENLDKLTVEIKTATSTIDPQIEGLHDFARLNLKPETKAVVDIGITDFERRRALLSAALEALNNLAGDGYPVVSQRQAVEAVYDDLRQNVATITAAFSKFDSIEEATTVEIVPGEPELKPTDEPPQAAV